MSLAYPPSQQPALQVDNGNVVGRIHGGDAGPFEFVTKRLTAADWAALQEVGCREVTQYGLGNVSVGEGGPPSAGGQTYVFITSNQGQTNMSFGHGADGSDAVVTTLRTMANKYCSGATF
jgi:hypothetical protein